MASSYSTCHLTRILLFLLSLFATGRASDDQGWEGFFTRPYFTAGVQFIVPEDAPLCNFTWTWTSKNDPAPASLVLWLTKNGTSEKISFTVPTINTTWLVWDVSQHRDVLAADPGDMLLLEMDGGDSLSGHGFSTYFSSYYFKLEYSYDSTTTTSPANATTSGTQVATTTSAGPSSALQSATHTSTPQSGLSGGAKAGTGVGASLVGVLFLTALGLFRYKKTQRAAANSHKEGYKVGDDLGGNPDAEYSQREEDLHQQWIAELGTRANLPEMQDSGEYGESEDTSALELPTKANMSEMESAAISVELDEDGSDRDSRRHEIDDHRRETVIYEMG